MKKQVNEKTISINDIVKVTPPGPENITLVDVSEELLKKYVDDVFTYSDRYKKFYPGFEKVRIDTELYTIDIKISLSQSQHDTLKGIKPPTEDIASILEGLDDSKLALIKSILEGKAPTATKGRRTKKV
jgi:hypothetical protein